MTLRTLRPGEKGYVFDDTRLFLCKVGNLEFSHRFQDLLIHAVLCDGSGHNEEAPIRFAAADLAALERFLATCRDRSVEIIYLTPLEVAPDPVGSAAKDEVGPGRT